MSESYEVKDWMAESMKFEEKVAKSRLDSRVLFNSVYRLDLIDAIESLEKRNLLYEKEIARLRSKLKARKKWYQFWK